MNDWINYVILSWLGLMTLRSILANSDVFPRGKKYSWLIYGNYDVDLIVNALKQAGIHEYDSSLVKQALDDAGIKQQDIANLAIQRRVNPNFDTVGREHLIEIISRYILFNSSMVQYGNKRKVKTSYYICTVEASQDAEYLKWMSILLVSLITDAIQKEELSKTPDFILTPKGGNTILGLKIAEMFDIPFLTSKFSIKNPYAPSVTGNSEYDLRTCFEGSWKLYEKQASNPDNPLCGIVVDCNTSTGEQIIDSVEYLNKLSENSGLSLIPIAHVFTLYRSVDNKGGDIDDLMKTAGIKYHRFFDLSEESKMKIYTERGEKEKLDVFSQEDLVKIRSILETLSSKK